MSLAAERSSSGGGIESLDFIGKGENGEMRGSVKAMKPMLRPVREKDGDEGLLL
jgi:hypothetical protein